MPTRDTEIRKTLENILEYVGADLEFVNDATLQTYMERLLSKFDS